MNANSIPSQPHRTNLKVIFSLKYHIHKEMSMTKKCNNSVKKNKNLANYLELIPKKW